MLLKKHTIHFAFRTKCVCIKANCKQYLWDFNFSLCVTLPCIPVAGFFSLSFKKFIQFTFWQEISKCLTTYGRHFGQDEDQKNGINDNQTEI